MKNVEILFNDNKIKFDKNTSDLDEFVFDFVKLLESCGIRYVIVSGYVAILFGRSRGTEDIDILIDRLDQTMFDKFFDTLIEKGYWIFNTENKKDALDMIEKHLALRIALKGDAIPNFELKYAKNEIDFMSLNGAVEVIVNHSSIKISPLEIQIPFKVWLGTEKDLEDAVHLYELFRDKLNIKIISSMAKKLKIEKQMEKYEIK